MLIKICGITNNEDAHFALEAGADWIGINLMAGPRRIELATARRIADSLDQPERAVALIEISGARPNEAAIHALSASGVRRFQIYGKVTPTALEPFAASGSATIVVQHFTDATSLDSTDRLLATCAAHKPDHVLLDTPSPDQLGGTGIPANWALMGQARTDGRFDHWPPIILAGGLNADNVAAAIHAVRPAGVDVSSGVETLPGEKNHAKIERFIAGVRTSAL
jgi:phosphoribosylanthranilate isomerase